jgi:branched-chain amino acid transport system ATP-binding protein
MALLETKQVVKRFGGLTAVDHLDLQVNEGEIVGLIGPNGSGKTTVLNVITGVYKPEEGHVIFDGKEIQGKSPHEVCVGGIARTFQNIRVMGPLSVYDNVRLGMHIQTKANLFSVVLGLPAVKKENKAIESVIEEALDIVGLLDKRNELVKNLPYGRQKVLESQERSLRSRNCSFWRTAAGLNPVEPRNLRRSLKRSARRHLRSPHRA